MFFKKTQEDVPLGEKKESAVPLIRQSVPRRPYDFILVSENDKEDEDKIRKEKAFIKKLKEKHIHVVEIGHDDKKMFYGLRAPEEKFEDYRYLLKVSDSCNSGDVTVTLATRIRIVHFILHHTRIITEDGEEEGLVELMKDGVFETKFCLHERLNQKKLVGSWARWTAVFKKQPYDDIQKYFGEKVALYYLWLGWYTTLLIPAAVLGVVVFLYALAFFKTNPLIKEVCESNITMCPRCEKRCPPWNLSDTCTYAKVSHLFDNEGTVAFAIFMAIWATLFLELWNRERAKHVSRWKVYDWCEEEEELIMEIVNNSECEPQKFKHSYLKSTLVLVMVTLMLLLIIGLAQALVVFRVVAAPLLSESKWEFMKDNANTVAVMLGAVAHYFTIQIMTHVNRKVSLKLCEWEKPNSFAAKEKSFTVKMFTFQFFTLFSSLFYVAFFLGRINGHPGNYARIAGFRLEECHPSGCLTDLFIQMAIIMMLKQVINNIVEFIVPWLKNFWRKRATKALRRRCGHCYRSACRDENGLIEPCEVCKIAEWLRNYQLADSDSFSLFNEFLEMVIQFSFTTIFVAAFPLAPLLALINNIFEIRLDAIKMVRLERRLVPKKTNSIGVWKMVLEAIGVLAVIANGLVIGITSDFIPRLIYRYGYGPCARGETGVHCMSGYINSTLTTAYMVVNNTDDFVAPRERHLHNVTPCSFRDFRSEEDHSLTTHFWLVLAARFAFVILFEHVVLVFKFVAAWFVPNHSLSVKNERLESKLKRLQEELEGRKKSKSKSTEV
ncbi:anoctamin-9 [Oryzias melastigma]|uniref:anoctamin-9 n=1 Tax=Oryzias melastigma TaxID=30732 RepID=UPI000CF7E53C|nr:anoctamin-9 [Oryzias melastigma]